MKPLLWLSLAALLMGNAHACIWDAESLSHEKSRSHNLATAILGEPPAAEDTNKLSARIQELEANRNEASAEWWNNLAGAYLRLNQPAQAVKVLEPAVSKFTNDYGIHANLGTAYHLLGRYAEAEKEIARDLEINPDAHFGLEKYHLALLQYLMRDTKYQSRHVYVDEFTAGFFSEMSVPFSFRGNEWLMGAENRVKDHAKYYTNGISEIEAEYADARTRGDRNPFWILGIAGTFDSPPAYRSKWNLAKDKNFEAGVIYMAQMNSKEPAAFEMLGLAAWNKRDYHLAVSAFQKAFELGSQKSDLLRSRVSELKDYIFESSQQSRNQAKGAAIFGCIVSGLLVLLWGIYRIIRKQVRPPAP